MHKFISLCQANIFYYVVQVMWLGMYSYVRVYYADNSHNLSIQSLYSTPYVLLTIRMRQALDWLDQSIYKFCGISRKGSHIFQEE